MVNRLNSNEDLVVVGPLTADDNSSTLVLQSDGNLVLYRKTGVPRWATSTTDGVSAVMQGDGNFVLYAPGGQAVWATGTDGHPGAVLVLQNDGNLVVYDTDGTPLWASDTVVATKAVPGFLPSTSGFHFSNGDFQSVPVLTIPVFGQSVGIGDASNGLCGGMVFAARDYFEAGIPIPPDTTNPSSGTLFDYIVKRLFDSFNLVLPLPPPPAPIPGSFITPIPPFGPGPVTYLHLMNPALPDHETLMSNIGLAYRGRAWVMIKDTWPRIQADIDNGHLSPIALVQVKSLDPTTLGANHQVLAYGYSLDGTDLTLRLYDPNAPDDDTVTMSLSIADPQHTTPVTNSVAPTVWCFFQPVYTFSFPPGEIQEQSDWRWCHKCQGLFYAAGQAAAGSCPASGQHERGISGNYCLAHEDPFAAGQPDWRWCHKCQGLFYAAGQATAGSCPASGQHEKGVSGNYTLEHQPAQ